MFNAHEMFNEYKEPEFDIKLLNSYNYRSNNAISTDNDSVDITINDAGTMPDDRYYLINNLKEIIIKIIKDSLEKYNIVYGKYDFDLNLLNFDTLLDIYMENVIIRDKIIIQLDNYNY